MPQPSPSAIDQTGIGAFRRRALLPWRLAFVAYALGLTTFTHLPNFSVAPPGAPPRDKILHWLCFGGLTILLWRTRWLRRGRDVVMIMLAWATLDELTQGWLVPGRQYSMLDLVASMLGAIAAGFIIVAMRPVGGAVNQLRVHRFEFLIDTLLARPKAWLALLPQTIGLALLVGGVVFFSTRWYHGSADRGATLVATAVGAIAGALGALAWLYRGELSRFCEQRTCAHCGASCAGAEVDDNGNGMCPACGRSLHLGQWTITADLPRAAISRIALRAAAPSVAFGVVILIGYALVVALYLRSPEFRRVAASSIRQMDIIGSAIDMTLITGLGALFLYRFRAGLARIFDRQAETCRACRHDVHATPVQRGLGRCPECGTEFMRVSAGGPGTPYHRLVAPSPLQ